MKTIFISLTTLIFLGSGLAYAAGPYTNSAHGTQNDAITGVLRTSTNQYTDGHCAHCHEQHSSIDGSEPSPTGGPDNYLLFDTSHTSQTANFCFDCHVDNASQQTGGFLNNYSYTYRAGGADDTTFVGDDIKEAFGDHISSHSLDNILTFITGKWGYTANSNPCCACHNPHAAQGDPAGSSSYKSSSTRGYPVSMPSLHSNLSSWGLWGDESGEKMSDYTNYYQAPYRYYTTSPSSLEPQGDSLTAPGPTTAAANTTDYVTFCQDCHSSTYGDMKAPPYSLSHTPIDWSTTGGEGGGDKHGKNIATQDIGAYYVNLLAPYSSVWSSSNGLVLACTDCHEAHGGFTVSLIRKVINGGVADAATWKSVCGRCHDTGGYECHHRADIGAPYPIPPLTDPCNCHPGGVGSNAINCAYCHFHGGDDSIVTGLGQTASGRRTF